MSSIHIIRFQEKKYRKQFIKFKFSSHQSNYAEKRPSLLGSNKLQSIFKDYNGQTYWITFDFNNKLQNNNSNINIFMNNVQLYYIIIRD